MPIPKQTLTRKFTLFQTATMKLQQLAMQEDHNHAEITRKSRKKRKKKMKTLTGIWNSGEAFVDPSKSPKVNTIKIFFSFYAMHLVSESLSSSFFWLRRYLLRVRAMDNLRRSLIENFVCVL